MYQAEALRAFAHDLADRIKEFELPVRQAMKAAAGDGLDAFAYSRMLQRRLDGMTLERDRLQRRGAELEQKLRDDAYAATFQSLAQYRTALLAASPPPSDDACDAARYCRLRDLAYELDAATAEELLETDILERVIAALKEVTP
jgi:hypothetical protein